MYLRLINPRECYILQGAPIQAASILLMLLLVASTCPLRQPLS
jgi:hypothetical protein